VPIIDPPHGPPAPRPEWLGRIAYSDALAIQESALENLVRGQGPERLFLLEHEPVYTIGRTRDRSSLLGGTLPHPVVETNRGGQATYHGPGQLVGYPILDLASRGRDLHRYLRFLEQVVIDTCVRYGVACVRREGLTGVWVGERKMASLGVGLRKWVTMHGLALNVCDTIDDFRHITPCGIAGVTMTSLETETGRSVTVGEVASDLGEVFCDLLPAGLGPTVVPETRM
jgi:lipoyl(octanoyl) transferase